MSRFAVIVAASLSNQLVGALYVKQKSNPHAAQAVPHSQTPYELKFVSKEKGSDNNGDPYTAITYELSTSATGPALNHSSLIIDPACDFVKAAKYSSDHEWQILTSDPKTDDLPVIKTATMQLPGESDLRTIAIKGDVELCRGTYVVKQGAGGVESFSNTWVPCCCEPGVGTCTIYGDPHVRPFDGSHMSLLREASESTSTGVEKVEGDVWLVRSRTMSIQGQYLPDETARTESLYLRAVATGGRWLNGNVLIVGSLAEKILWNGEEVLQHPGSSFEVPGFIRAVRNPNSTSVKDGTEAPALEVFLPNDVNLKINRLTHHVNFRVGMPRAPTGGQEGLCGNFNGLAADDELFQMTGPRDPRVAAGESLFQ